MSELSPPRIVCAAIRVTNEALNSYLLVGPRHYDKLMREQLSFIEVHNHRLRKEQGFIDQHGNFYTREQAWIIAMRNWQIIRRVDGDTANGGTLYSENLY